MEKQSHGLVWIAGDIQTNLLPKASSAVQSDIVAQGQGLKSAPGQRWHSLSEKPVLVLSYPAREIPHPFFLWLETFLFPLTTTTGKKPGSC